MIWITNQIESETHHTGVKPMLFHHLAHQRKFDDPFCHLNAALPKFLGQYRRELLEHGTTGATQKFEFEFHAVLVANAVAIVVLPAGLIEQFRGPFRVVRQWFDVRIEVSCLWSERCYSDLPKAHADRFDDFLAIDQHRHRLPYALVFEEWPFIVPKDFVLVRNEIRRLGKLFFEALAAGLILELNRQQPWLEIDVACL